MQEAKKKWSQPKLIILVRGKPEERILGSCKGSGGGPYDMFNGCLMFNVPPQSWIGPTSAFAVTDCSKPCSASSFS
jgi:hypothetical protein